MGEKQPEKLANARIVLVETTHPGNIGAVARAMKNMGLSQLVLVSPRSFPDEKATWRAAGATDLLEQAVVVETLDEALQGCELVVATSSRNRTIPWPLLDARHCAQQISAELEKHSVALVFGREDRGLTNEELQRCNLHACIPGNPDYSVLNVAMAAQIMCYELRMAAMLDKPVEESMTDWDVAFASSDDLERFFVHLQSVLVDMKFLNPKAPKQLMTRLRRLFSRTRLDEMEVSILRGVLSSAERLAKQGKSSDPAKVD